MDRKECYRLTHPLSKISGHCLLAYVTGLRNRNSLTTRTSRPNFTLSNRKRKKGNKSHFRFLLQAVGLSLAGKLLQDATMNGNGQKGMLQIDAPPVENFWQRHWLFAGVGRTVSGDKSHVPHRRRSADSIVRQRVVDSEAGPGRPPGGPRPCLPPAVDQRTARRGRVPDEGRTVPRSADTPPSCTDR